MRPVLSLLLIATLATTGCARIADSRLNPLNLFKGSGAVPRDADGNVKPLVTARDLAVADDSRTLIASVDTVTLENVPGGAVLRATGRAAGQGFYDAGLVPLAGSDGTLVYEFRVRAPATQPAGLTPQQITVATKIDSATLGRATSIIVMAAQSGRSVGR
ncbi:hypothetical protein [Loktanella sp. M215]|uniref:hypothetical protein n=1 Tax=Loktanella sp. M215 TaxID=2675431 RepID=UPI001F2EEA4D|nr:hypothetical protein [Loktanella sp. M215]MCF7700651.1 hypothetical protein [Loktanella sp. M215]